MCNLKVQNKPSLLQHEELGGGEALYGVIALKKTQKKTEKPYSRMIKVEM